MSETEADPLLPEKTAQPFKKPILVGKIGHFPKKIHNVAIKPPTPALESEEPMQIEEKPEPKPQLDFTVSPAEKLAENATPSPYKEPTWSGLPQSSTKGYIFEILKNGSIIETVDLMSKAFWVFGRLPACDIPMQHPTISRYHAVLQYRSEKSETEESGFYIYDLGSTHGTFLNKNRLKSRIYVRIQVGHMLKLGCSTRTFILNGPNEDTEEESSLSVTELKQKRLEELKRREDEEKQALLLKEQHEAAMKKKLEEKGIDWGLGEDADEEADLSENPYAQTNNEELYLDNPKKALRGFFEREGLDLDYDCTEQGMGQFCCKVELPIDDENGRPIVAEVFHKGKKKEAVVQCALEACRMLDRHGVLRQATHESRKRKPKNWEENDYYDSDDDTFLDRTGAIEKKREMRMKNKLPPKVETYESLLAKEKSIKEAIDKLERQLLEAQRVHNSGNASTEDEDSLDLFMKDLKDKKSDKHATNRLKNELFKLRQEHNSVVKLVNIAKPADLPSLVSDSNSTPSTSSSSPRGISSSSSNSKSLPIFGKRKKIKLHLPEKEEPEENRAQDSEEDLPEEITAPETKIEEKDDPEDDPNLWTLNKFEEILEKHKLPPFADKHQDKLAKILHSLKRLATDGDRMDMDWKILEAKKRKVVKLIFDLNNSEHDEKLEFRVSSELNRILNELNTMTEQKFKVISKVKKMGNELKSISDEINADMKKFKDSQDEDDDNKKSGKNKRRIQQRQEKAEIEKLKGYEEDAKKEDYNMWVPPSNQSGDGRTSLNDKLGY